MNQRPLAEDEGNHDDFRMRLECLSDEIDAVPRRKGPPTPVSRRTRHDANNTGQGRIGEQEDPPPSKLREDAVQWLAFDRLGHRAGRMWQHLISAPPKAKEGALTT